MSGNGAQVHARGRRDPHKPRWLAAAGISVDETVQDSRCFQSISEAFGISSRALGGGTACRARYAHVMPRIYKRMHTVTPGVSLANGIGSEFCHNAYASRPGSSSGVTSSFRLLHDCTSSEILYVFFAGPPARRFGPATPLDEPSLRQCRSPQRFLAMTGMASNASPVPSLLAKWRS